ncbi:aspartate--tRNA ligase msd1 [Elasticomyces elasticus]|nr:hypothetical protein LTR28_010635 [Elasticomyces elasticus]KAK4984368.1 aspartate--tRNA ligase msd1 [Elasticomyces elasticus]
MYEGSVYPFPWPILTTEVKFPNATHTHQDLLAHGKTLVGHEVVIHGYLGSRRDAGKGFSFCDLVSNDLSHSIQLTAKAGKDESTLSALTLLRSLNRHTPVAVRGVIAEASLKEKFGDLQNVPNIELKLAEICRLNEFPADIIMQPETVFSPEQRHLQIRNTKQIRTALEVRSNAAHVCRKLLAEEEGFIEVETPLLFKSTPEGAREFLVPTRAAGLAYALPQSPQQYKQILMSSGIPRYFQFAKCFRDEDLRADRQPEFTQIDLEMAFATGADVMNVIEKLIRQLWSNCVDQGSVQLPFRRMTYAEAMSTYGSDKPDLRFGSRIRRIEYMLPVDLVSKIGPLSDPIVEVVKMSISDKPKETSAFVASFMDSPEAKPFIENPDGQPGIFIFDPRRPLQGLQPFGFEAAEQLEELLELDAGDLVVIQARKNAPFAGGSTPIGNLRLALHRAAVSRKLLPASTDFEFLWITDFPLFSPAVDTEPGQGGTAGIASTHHPFTAPKSAEDVDMLLTDPLQAKAEHYDLVVNGVELGGGSQRIHHAKVQEYILRDILKIGEERMNDFAHLLDVLRAGCPPHAGIALGFDRLVAVMLGRESVRDVIAFPKSGRGEDLLVKSPSRMTKKQLETYHLQLSV